ncbi:MAG: 30S ribosomal protein S12 methylthiotransferase RimO [Clostridiales bacterium]|jgi:ribosomal protein S12 methylthiotransferase|nr:30S ribosomal protein S12 methylthiotransferase RimO [Clostridiales bacterium]
MEDKRTVSLISLGCDKNLVDSEALLGALSGEESLIFTDDEEEARIIIINTCGFIKDAVDEASGHIQRALELKESGSCQTVAVTGCMVQRYGERMLADFPGIDILEPMPVKLAERLGFKRDDNQGRALATPGHYAYLKIAEGCDNRCSYCAIPYIKGPYTSRPMEDIIEEAEKLAAGGVKELIIVAQDTALYGRDIYGKQRLNELINRLSEVESLRWLRLMYCYPEHITDELIAAMAGNPKVCHYLDMPIQHAAGNILRAMGRKTDGSGLRALIDRLRAAMPDIILRTTVMTGFPGESHEDFQELLAFLEDVKFDKLGAFAYSREEMTPAYNFLNQVPKKTKESRKNRVMEQQNAISAEKLNGYIGRELEVLADGYDAVNKIFYGRSYMDCPETDGLTFITAPKGALEPGEFARVQITEAFEYDLIGRLIK